MKKQKLVFGVIPIFLLCSSFMGCNKNDKTKVTNDEFKKALAYIKEQTADRKYTSKGETDVKIKQNNEVITDVKTYFETLVSGFDEVDNERVEGGTKVFTTYYHTDNNEHFEYLSDVDMWSTIDNGTDVLPSVKTALLYDIYINRASTFVYHNGNYQINDVKVEYEYLGIKMTSEISCFITFEDKKIKRIEEKSTSKYADSISEGNSIVIEQTTDFSDYNTTVINDMPSWEKPTFTGEVTELEWKIACSKLYSIYLRNYYLTYRFMDYPVFVMAVNGGDVEYLNIADNVLYQKEIGGAYAQFDETGIIQNIYDFEDENELVNYYVPNTIYYEEKTGEEYEEKTKSLFESWDLFKFDNSDKTYKYEYKKHDEEITYVYTIKFSVDKYGVKSLMEYSVFAKGTDYGMVYDFVGYTTAKIEMPEVKNYVETTKFGSETIFKSNSSYSYAANDKCLYLIDFSKAQDFNENDKVHIYLQTEDGQKVSDRISSIECIVGDGTKISEIKPGSDGKITLFATGMGNKELVVFINSNDKVSGSENLNLVVEYNQTL